MLTTETVRRSVPRAGFIRGLFDDLRRFEIERPINHFIPVTGPLDFCPEPDDIPSVSHHQGTVNRHQIGQEMCTLENRLIQSR